MTTPATSFGAELSGLLLTMPDLSATAEERADWYERMAAWLARVAARDADSSNGREAAELARVSPPAGGPVAGGPVTTMPLLPRLGRPCLVDEIRCPHCGQWVKPRKFDLEHMACKRCRRTLARPGWTQAGWWLR